MNIKNQELLDRLGQRLREIRVEKGWSQELLANTAELPINQIGRIERGEFNTTIVTLERISVALEIKLSKLLDGI